MAEIEVRFLGRGERAEFLSLPLRWHGRDASYRPLIPGGEARLIDPSRNPLLQNGPHALIVAKRDGVPVMRAMAGSDEVMKRATGLAQGWFALFDGQDDEEAAHALMRAVEAFEQAQGNRQLVGPDSPDGSGLFLGLPVEMASERPLIFQPFGPRYLCGFLERVGFVTESDFLTYHLTVREALTRRYADYAALARVRFGVEAREMNPSRRADMEALSIALSGEGAAPDDLTARVLGWTAAYMRREYLLCAFSEGRPIGALIGLPDVNDQLLRAGPHFVKNPFKRVRALRAVTLNVVRGRRGGAATLVLFARFLEAARIRGVSDVFASNILTENLPSRAGVERLGGIKYGVIRRYIRRF